MGIRQDTTKKGTTMTNKYQKNTPKTSSGPGLAIPDEVSIAMGEIAEDMREGLLALAVGAGLQVMATLMEADVAAVCGPRGKHDPRRSAVRHGRERGSVTLGGRRVGVDRPRMRASDGGEVPVAAYELFSRSEILGRMAMGKMLGGLSSRRYRVGLEPVGEKLERAASATSKSAVSRRFVAMTETALAELLAAPLGNLDLVALMIDGVHFGEHLCVVALGIGIDGTKHPPRTGRRQHREHHRRDRTAHRPKRRPICSGLCLTSSCCWTWSRNRSCRADSRLGPAGPLVRARLGHRCPVPALAANHPARQLAADRRGGTAQRPGDLSEPPRWPRDGS